MLIGKRRKPILIAVVVILVVPIAWHHVRLNAIHDRVERRTKWTREAEAELKELTRRLPSSPTAADLPQGHGTHRVRFQEGWANGRVHTGPDDARGGGTISGLGDLVVLIDHNGLASYSAQHICDGILPGSGSSPDDGGIAEEFRNAASLDAYLAAFGKDRPENGWKNDISAIVDDTRWRSLSFP